MLADEVRPDNDGENPFPEVEFQVSNSEKPSYSPQTSQTISLCYNNIFHLFIIANFLTGYNESRPEARRLSGGLRTKFLSAVMNVGHIEPRRTNTEGDHVLVILVAYGMIQSG